MGKLTTDGLTMNQLAECNAEYVMTIAELEEKCAALAAKLSMINDLMEVAEQVNKLAQEAAEKLVQECNALAAENTGLKAAKEIIRHLNVNREEANFCGIDDCYIDDAVAAMITPATDAFLAEVRAHGVESAGEYLKQYAQGLHEEARLVLQDAGELCNGFAAQLRKGGAA
ncbi:hypothetical protein OOP60_003500 [Salmonella enterica]|nr:hypothetical protein [Salmonella enterica]EKB5474828.1 hypothetical protein [Salmonella enterica]ELL0514725.1 hypothetical protein [Salmonella enterica]